MGTSMPLIYDLGRLQGTRQAAWYSPPLLASTDKGSNSSGNGGDGSTAPGVCRRLPSAANDAALLPETSKGTKCDSGFGFFETQPSRFVRHTHRCEAEFP